MYKQYHNPSPPPSLGRNPWATTCNKSDSTQQGWSYNAQTSAIHGPGSTCLDYSSSQLELQPCNGQSTQKFTYSGSGSTAGALCVPGSNARCLDVYEGQGPLLQLYGFHNGTNELFVFTSDGFMQDKDNVCIAARNTTPTPDPSPVGENVVQLWTKPQPNGAMAVFFISSQDSTGKNSSYTVTFKELNITTSSASVRDIWQHKDLGVFQNQFTTDVFGGLDSRFYLVSPHSEAQQKAKLAPADHGLIR